MSDIKLTENESALWHEVGSRGDLFRAAMRDRAVEQTRLSGRMTEICDPIGRMLDAVQPPERDIAGELHHNTSGPFPKMERSET
jgi:hypothetical protein